jgi:hypothetical protein
MTLGVTLTCAKLKTRLTSPPAGRETPRSKMDLRSAYPLLSCSLDVSLERTRY